MSDLKVHLLLSRNERHVVWTGCPPG